MKIATQDQRQILKDAFPERFVFFFSRTKRDATEYLTGQGEMALEYLAMKKLLQCAEFTFHKSKEVLCVSLGDIPVLADTAENELQEIASEFLEGCGLAPIIVRVI